MIAEIGLFSLILALFFAILLVFVPMMSIKRHPDVALRAALIYVWGQVSFVVLAYVCLTVCFLRDDFSVTYVLMNSSLALPFFYKLCAVWGGHEGSMLLWILVLSLWMGAVMLSSRSLDVAIRVRVLVVLGGLSVGFILFLLMTSNPFLRQFQLLDSPGRDLNPLLQDIGFLFHPPMLYMGYVGFSVAFAFAIAALWLGRVEPAWARFVRPWTLIAWCFLTAGITLGSWWAYRELGWGGWWFWDPVENASFMPWLAGTALIHALIFTEKRQQYVAWTLLLAIIVFSLSLVGTFLVRSGVLTSVHAFAVDPARGLYILFFLSCVIGGSLTLHALYAKQLNHGAPPAPISRGTALLFNNVFLVVAMLTVLLGTIYPLLMDGLGLGQLSVGAPYFNAVFVPLMLPVLVLMGFGIHLGWRDQSLYAVLKPLRGVLGLSCVLPWILLLGFTHHVDLTVYLSLVLACWIIGSTLQSCLNRIKQRGGLLRHVAWFGMSIAHVGVAVSAIGIAVSSGYGFQDDVRLAPGDSANFAGFNVVFDGQRDIVGPNYQGTQARFLIVNRAETRSIYPEKRIYTIGRMPMTESAIDVTPFRDLYVALGEPLAGNAWSVRLYYKPFVRWIWAGGFLMVLGALVAMCDRRLLRVKTS